MLPYLKKNKQAKGNVIDENFKKLSTRAIRRYDIVGIVIVLIYLT